MRFERATAREHLELLQQSLDEAARSSFGQDLTAAERDALHRRLADALHDPLSIVEVGCVGGAVLCHYWMEIRPGALAFVLHFYVAPERRGQGTSHRLWARVEDRARSAGCHQIRLAVAEANGRAVRFYDRLGLQRFDEEERDGGRWFEYRLEL